MRHRYVNLLFLFTVLVLPLQRYINVTLPYITPRFELNAVSILFLVILLLGYFYFFVYQGTRIKRKPIIVTILLLLLFAWLFLESFIGGNPNPNELLRLLSIILALPIIVVLLEIYPIRKVALGMAIVLALHSLWGIAQFSLQRDLGLTFFGETNISAADAGIAKFMALSRDSTSVSAPLKLVRAYGPYPHPNALGGVLVLGLMYAWISNHYLSSKSRFLLLYVLSLGIVLTFSRSAWLAAAIFLVALWSQYKKYQPAAKNALKTFTSIMLITIVVLLPLIVARATDKQDTAIPERISGLSYALAIIETNPLWYGTGPGNYTIKLTSYLQENNITVPPWEIAPVHNTFLLMLAEWGLVPGALILSALLYWLAPMFKRSWQYVLPVLPLALFDHYFLTELAPLVYLMLWLALVRQVSPELPPEQPGKNRAVLKSDSAAQ